MKTATGRNSCGFGGEGASFAGMPAGYTGRGARGWHLAQPKLSAAQWRESRSRESGWLVLAGWHQHQRIGQRWHQRQRRLCIAAVAPALAKLAKALTARKTCLASSGAGAQRQQHGRHRVARHRCMAASGSIQHGGAKPGPVKKMYPVRLMKMTFSFNNLVSLAIWYMTCK